MSLMSALLDTYDFALDNGLVDNAKLGVNGLTLLPVYHSNKKSNGEDIFELTIDENSEAVAGRFLAKGERVVFPITEDSITRSGAKVAPHAICDELSYLAKEIDPEKNKAYISGIEALLTHEESNPCQNLRIFGEYLMNHDVLKSFIACYVGKKAHILEESVLHVEEKDEQGKEKCKSMDLNKIFITFKLGRKNAGDLPLSNDINLHRFYIDYVREKNRTRELSYCDITGSLDYCVERHRGIIGNAKLISISNNDETYYGRLKNGADIYHISYEASQKVHNMLKYLVDNNSHAGFLGAGAYVINWLSKELDKGGLSLLSDAQKENRPKLNESQHEIINDDDDDDIPDVKEITMSELGGGTSEVLKNYFTGKGGTLAESEFYVLIIEKISNGRVSIKHFKRLSTSDAHERIEEWYRSMEWKHFKQRKAPTLYQIVDFLYGYEGKEGFLKCDKDTLKRSQLERLIPCMLEAKKMPRDMVRLAFNKLSRRQSYQKQWNMAMFIGCSLIKKYRKDDLNILIDPERIEEVEYLKESISFYYGRLAAVYEKVELEAVRKRDFSNVEKVEEGKGEKAKFGRVTNMDRLYSAMIRMPERTAFILSQRVKPYFNMIAKRSRAEHDFYERLIAEINGKIEAINELGQYKGGAVDEDFYIGYYHQKNKFYQGGKKNNGSVTDNKNKDEAVQE